MKELSSAQVDSDMQARHLTNIRHLRYTSSQSSLPPSHLFLYFIRTRPEHQTVAESPAPEHGVVGCRPAVMACWWVEVHTYFVKYAWVRDALVIRAVDFAVLQTGATTRDFINNTLIFLSSINQPYIIGYSCDTSKLHNKDLGIQTF